MKSLVRKYIGQNIAQAREAAGLNQTQLSEKLGVAPNVISCWESGAYLPGDDKTEKLCKYLFTTPEKLLAGTTLNQAEKGSETLINTVSVQAQMLAKKDLEIAELRNEIERLKVRSGRPAFEQGIDEADLARAKELLNRHHSQKKKKG